MGLFIIVILRGERLGSIYDDVCFICLMKIVIVP